MPTCACVHVIELRSLSSILGVLTALIAPALLISACATFIISTSARLARNVDQMRELAMRLRNCDHTGSGTDQRKFLHRQLERMFRRVRQQQRALALFYWAAVLFVTCSLALGTEAFTQVLPNWLPVMLGLTGVVMLLVACSLLLAETRLLVAGMTEEMQAIVEEGQANDK
jgi:hypothetical protein